MCNLISTDTCSSIMYTFQGIQRSIAKTSESMRTHLDKIASEKLTLTLDSRWNNI